MISILIILIILTYIIIKGLASSEKRARVFISWWCTIILVFFSGFRHLAVGVDTFYYIYSLHVSEGLSFDEVFFSFWNKYLYASVETGKDPGFKVLEWFFSRITTNSTAYLLFIGTAFLLPLRTLFLRYTRTPWELAFSYIIYTVLFFNYLPNAAIRQAIAMIALIYVYCYHKEWIWYKILFLLFIASFIHQSVLVGLVVFIFPYIKNIRMFYIICGCMFVIMFVLGNVFATLISSFSDVYSSYAESDYYSSGNAKPYNFIIFMFMIYLLSFVQTKNNDFVEKNKTLLFIVGISMVLTPLILVQPNFQRLTAMFAICICAFLPKCLTEYSLFIRRFAYILLFFVFFALASRNEYKFNWQHMEFNERYLHWDVNI